MSHNKLRDEKTCLNCGHTVEERYCPNCSQENIELHDSAFHLFIHFVQDIFHYDGKFWHTFRVLIRKPGQVAAEYIDGKRMLNIQPIRFYFFTSTLFFLLFFYVINLDNTVFNHNPAAELNKRMYFLKKEKEHRTGSADTLDINKLIESLQCSIDSIDGANGLGRDTLETGVIVDPTYGESDTTGLLDSLGWLGRMLDKRNKERKKEFEEKNPGDTDASNNELIKELLHKLPQLIFLSLPFFAFFLKILYFRAKRRLYVEHLIFSIYQYSYLYAMLSVFLLINWASSKINSDAFDTIADYGGIFIIIYLFIYLMLAMKRFYVGRWRYLLPKYFILNFLMVVTIICLALLVGTVTYLL
jgi:hypothetical protein